MSTRDTKAFIESYAQTMPAPTDAFRSMFRAPQMNFHNSEKVEIDIMRNSEDVAVVVRDLRSPYREVIAEGFSNKEFTPPVYKEKLVFNAYDLLRRQFGSTSYDNPQFRAALMARIARQMQRQQYRITRAMELQASQVMQTGAVTLTDEIGNAIYELDYAPKATHMVTVGTLWTDSGADPISDIDNVADEIRTDSGREVTMLMMGAKAFNAFISLSSIQSRFNNRRIDQGTLSPMVERTPGLKYRGRFDGRSNQYEIVTYDGQYKDPSSGDAAKYLDPWNVVLLTDGARYDATFGDIPDLGDMFGLDQSLRDQIGFPRRMSMPDQKLDLITKVWIDQDRTNLHVGYATRPLFIPVEIDSFGRLTVGSDS